MARARYMLIASFPHLFAETVIAEMRGWQDENSRSPFWDAIGARFFDLPFEEADRLSALEGAGFIAELMPKYPIYTALLPDAARTAIGKPHHESAKAMAMLLAEDFRYDGHVDVFDGGPQIHIARDKIRTVTDSRPARVAKNGPARPAVPLLLSNTLLTHFRVIETEGCAENGTVILDDQMRRILDVQSGDTVRVAPGAAGTLAQLTSHRKRKEGHAQKRSSRGTSCRNSRLGSLGCRWRVGADEQAAPRPSYVSRHLSGACRNRHKPGHRQLQPGREPYGRAAQDGRIPRQRSQSLHPAESSQGRRADRGPARQRPLDKAAAPDGSYRCCECEPRGMENRSVQADRRHDLFSCPRHNR
jgi:hypothetical protein